MKRIYHFSEDMQTPYVHVNELRSRDLAEFATMLDNVPDEAPCAWYSHKDELAYPGVWVARQACRLKNASFVDPEDLSCYGGQYYEPAPGGRIDCLRLDREVRPAPENAQHVHTAGQLKAVVANLIAHFASEEGELSHPRLVEPSATFEWHGKLAWDWHARLLEEDVAQQEDALDAAPDAGDETKPAAPRTLLVFG